MADKILSVWTKTGQKPGRWYPGLTTGADYKSPSDDQMRQNYRVQERLVRRIPDDLFPRFALSRGVRLYAGNASPSRWAVSYCTRRYRDEDRRGETLRDAPIPERSAGGSHAVTVNDTRPGATPNGWGRSIASAYGGVIQHDMDHGERQRAYGCDITYGTNNEIG